MWEHKIGHYKATIVNKSLHTASVHQETQLQIASIHLCHSRRYEVLAEPCHTALIAYACQFALSHIQAIFYLLALLIHQTHRQITLLLLAYCHRYLIRAFIIRHQLVDSVSLTHTKRLAHHLVLAQSQELGRWSRLQIGLTIFNKKSEIARH